MHNYEQLHYTRDQIIGNNNNNINNKCIHTV